MEQFRKLDIPDYLLQVIEQDKFEKPSEVQEKAIPLVLAGKDVIAESATGSGKTLAFGCGIIKYCEKIRSIQALVLVPTRELADQVAKALKHFSKNKPLEIVEIYGGMSMQPQIQKLQRADIVVGTPGRILDHLGHNTADFSRVKMLILDEADRMLDMGFIQDVEKIMDYCPAEKQTLLFSATIPREISNLSKQFMNDPVHISAEPQVDPKKLRQYYYDIGDYQKFSLLVTLLKQEHPGLVMVFCNTQKNTDLVARNLQDNEIEVSAIHGGLSQNKRSNIMSNFHANKVGVLVCTDVAARGLDIPGVSHIYNYDVPNEPTQYIHRIGRTARAGKDGVAITLLASRDYNNFSNLQSEYELNIEKKELPEMISVAFRYKSFSRFGGEGRYRGGGRGHGRRDGGRGSKGRFGGRSGGRKFSDNNQGGFHSHRSRDSPRTQRFQRKERYFRR